MNTRKLPPVRVTEPWHWFFREAVESPLLEMFKSYLDKFLGNWLQVALKSRGLDQRTSEGPFQIQLFCDFNTP